ncbi:MAG: glycine cleavage system aminomethyltransferase GcvT [Rhizobiaceae bacterium]
MSIETLKELPLKSLHDQAGAKFGGFAGWNMPITYPLGVLKEHLHTRDKAGLFDISHMQLFELTGASADAALAATCPVDPSTIDIGESKYTLLLNAKAGIIDDLIVTRHGADRWIIVANASRGLVDGEHIRGIVEKHDCRLKALDRVFLAIQGPTAVAAAKDCGIDGSDLTFMHGKELDGLIITRSGYTGEDGLEIAVLPKDAMAIAERLIAHPDVEWIGLAARDSLRLEAGLCLYGNDMDEATDPVSASLVWAIPKALRETGTFHGAKAFRVAIASGPPRKRVGLKPEGRMPVRNGAILTDANGNEIGVVTSGGFGPSVNHPVAMGYVTKVALDSGSPLFADVRGTKIPVDIAPLPFTPHRYVKG